MSIKVSYDSKRGCGYRKMGGLYLISEPGFHGCGLLPLKLDICPTCGHGIKPALGWTWVNPKELVKGLVCESCEEKQTELGFCGTAYCNWTQQTRAGLIWVGQTFYKTAEDFKKEALRLGISRRIHTIPRGFKVGETWVLLAHRKGGNGEGVVGGQPDFPAIFTAFLPQRIEQIVRGDENDEEIEKLEKRGITPVVIKPESEKGKE